MGENECSICISCAYYFFIGMSCIWRGVPIVWNLQRVIWVISFGAFASFAHTSHGWNVSIVQSSSTPCFGGGSRRLCRCRHLSVASFILHTLFPFTNVMSPPSHNTVTFPTNEYHPFKSPSSPKLDFTIYKTNRGLKKNLCLSGKLCVV